MHRRKRLPPSLVKHSSCINIIFTPSLREPAWALSQRKKLLSRKWLGGVFPLSIWHPDLCISQSVMHQPVCYGASVPVWGFASAAFGLSYMCPCWRRKYYPWTFKGLQLNPRWLSWFGPQQLKPHAVLSKGHHTLFPIRIHEKPFGISA